MTNTEYRLEGGGWGINRTASWNSTKTVSLFVWILRASCSSLQLAVEGVEKGKGRNLKGETKELCIISVWLGVFCSVL